MEFLERFKNSYVQTFDDTKQNTRGFVSMFPVSEYTKKEAWLIENNKNGMGVFFTPNPCSGGRKEENVMSVEYLYVDLDDYTEEQMTTAIRNCPIPPHMVVFSGRGFHLYWKCRCTGEQFTQAIKNLIFYFDGDPAISSTNEVLRIPGFLHMKDPQSPKEVSVLREDFSYDVVIGDILSAYEAPAEQIKKSFSLSNDDLAIIKDISITKVLEKLGVEIRRRGIWFNGEATSAMVNESGNYINRFSGKPGSGSTIDAAMEYGNMDLPQAIKWLKDMAGIKDKPSPEKIAKAVVLDSSTIESDIDKDAKVFTWGTNSLDASITPIQSHHYSVITGDTGAGKTTFAFDVAWKNAMKGKTVLFLSLEMTRTEIYNRLARGYAGITKAEWRNRATIPESKRGAYNKRLKEVQEVSTLVLAGFPRGVDPTTDNIFATVEEASPDLVFIDNFDLIHKSDKVSEYQEQNRIAAELMNYSKDKNVPLILLHHKKKGKDAGNDAARGSGKIIHNCDTHIECARTYDVDASPEENAQLTVKTMKDRDFGQLVYCSVYFRRGEFYDEFI